MGYSTSNVRNIRTVKALRGEILTIDLGLTFTGTLTAHMKKDPNDETYRAFDIRSNRYLDLTAAKTSDYYLNGKLEEEIKGKWYFDVKQLEDGADVNTSKTIYRGTILFRNGITNGTGVEISGVDSSLKTYEVIGTALDIIIVPGGLIVNNANYQVFVNGQKWYDVSIGGLLTTTFATGTIQFGASIEGKIVEIRYN
jgi:hypothetical protein